MERYKAKGILKGDDFEYESQAITMFSFLRYVSVAYPTFEIKEVKVLECKHTVDDLMYKDKEGAECRCGYKVAYV